MKKRGYKKSLTSSIRPVFWFFVGVFFAAFCIGAFLLVFFKITFRNRIIPGVFIGGLYVGEKTPQEVEAIFEKKNKKIGETTLTFTVADETATASAQDFHIGYDSKLIANQAVSIGNSKDPVSNVYYILTSYFNGTYLSPAYSIDREKVSSLVSPFQRKIYKEPVDALFKVENNKVVAFKESENGKTIDINEIVKNVEDKTPSIIEGREKNVIINISVKILKPAVSTEAANGLGIVEAIGTGNSKFAHSIPNRIHNVALAASKINGVIVAPGETFSFVKILGDVTKYTG